MWIRIMAKNDHQRASVSTPINNFLYFFTYFICGVELPALWMNCRWWNILFARITQLSTDFWYKLYLENKAHSVLTVDGFPCFVMPQVTQCALYGRAYGVTTNNRNKGLYGRAHSARMISSWQRAPPLLFVARENPWSSERIFRQAKAK